MGAALNDKVPPICSGRTELEQRLLADACELCGSTLDIVLEHELALDGSQIQYTHVGQASPITPPPARQE